MTAVKLCGLKRAEDVLAANLLMPDLVGFVFAKKSKRYITPETAEELKSLLDPDIKAVGVFVDEDINVVASYLEKGIIDIAQLHGSEDDGFVRELKKKTGKQIIKAFRVIDETDLLDASLSCADYILLDAGNGDGRIFDWSVLNGFDRQYFLAGGLTCENVAGAVEKLKPFGVDVSSGIETDGAKDPVKMNEFVNIVRSMKE